MNELAARLALAALVSNLVLASCTTGKPRQDLQPVPVKASDRAEVENLIGRAASASSEESAIFELGPKMLDVGEAARQVLRDEISIARPALRRSPPPGLTGSAARGS